MSEDQAIHIRRRVRFSQISNGPINDEALSADGLALLVYLCSKAEGWLVMAGDIRRRFGWGKNKVYQVIGHLIEQGYMIRSYHRTGGVTKPVYAFDDDKCFPGNGETTAASAFPEIKKPEKRFPGNRDHNNTRELQNTELFNNTEDCGRELVPVSASWPANAWEAFYTGYPHKVGRAAAKKAFDSARKKFSASVPFSDILAGLTRYIETKPPDRPWCNPATWLNQQRWADEPAAVASVNGSRATRTTMLDVANELRDGGDDGLRASSGDLWGGWSASGSRF
jgi:hypothetical protein